MLYTKPPNDDLTEIEPDTEYIDSLLQENKALQKEISAMEMKKGHLESSIQTRLEGLGSQMSRKKQDIGGAQFNELYFILNEKEEEIQKLKQNLRLLQQQHKEYVHNDHFDEQINKID